MTLRRSQSVWLSLSFDPSEGRKSYFLSKSARICEKDFFFLEGGLDIKDKKDKEKKGIQESIKVPDYEKIMAKKVIFF